MLYLGMWRSLSHKIANDRNAFRITSGDSVPAVDSNSKEGNIFYNSSTGKIRIREESAWQVTSKRSIKNRDEFKILHGTSSPSANTLQRVFYNTNTKKLQYLKNNSWRSVAEEEVAGDTFNVGVDSYKFSLNNAVQPELNLYRGYEYVFNQSSADNSGQRLFVSNDLSGRNMEINPNDIVKLGGAGGIYTSGGSKYSTTPATFQLNSNANLIESDAYGETGEVSFDNNTNTYYANVISGGVINNANNDEIAIIIIFPNPVIVNKYQLWSRIQSGYYASRPKSWQLRATNNINTYLLNDNTTYTELDSQTVTTWTDWPSPDSNTIPEDDEDLEFTFTNTNSYTTYILNFTEGFRDNFLALSEIAYYGLDSESVAVITENTNGFTSTGTLGTDLVSKWTIPTDASDTMYYASDGSANAGGKINITDVPAQEKTFVVDVSLIEIKTSSLLAGAGALNGTGGSEGTATHSSTYGGGWEGYNAFGGGQWLTSQNQPVDWLKFEFPYDVTITKYKIWRGTRGASAPSPPKTWELRSVKASQTYSESDPNTYTVIHDISDVISVPLGQPQSPGNWPWPDANSIAEDVSRLEFTVIPEKQEKGRTIILHITERNNSASWGTSYVEIGEIAYYGYTDSSPSEYESKFAINSELQPTLNLYRGSVYKFDQSDASNVGQRLYVSNDVDGRSMVLDPNNRIAEAGGDGGLKGTGGAEGTAGESHSFHPEYTYLKIFDNNLSGSFISGNGESGWQTSLPVEIYFEFPTAKVIKAEKPQKSTIEV